MEDFLDILRLKPSIKDGTEELRVRRGAHAGLHGNMHAASMDTDSVPVDGLRGLSVDFKDVGFSYNEDRPVRRHGRSGHRQQSALFLHVFLHVHTCSRTGR